MESFTAVPPDINAEQDNLSLSILGIKWNEFFPLSLGTQDQVRTIDLETTMHFFESKYDTIYGKSDSPFRSDPFSQKKHLYYRTAGDFFGFFRDTQLCGIFIGTIIDWNSYYFRNCSMIPEYQGNGNYQKLLLHLLHVLSTHGVERVEGDVAPSNLGHIHVLNKLQFNITGFSISDRWGTMLHFTKFLRKETESLFLNQFCHGVKPQLESTQENKL